MAELKISELNKNYGLLHVLKNINIEIEDGKFVVLVGPSGCGKSTLLRSIAGLEEVSSGQINIGHRMVNDVDPADRGVAMVFQSYALYPHMNVFQNMSFGLRMAKKPKVEIEQRVNNAAKILKIEHLLKRKPKELSGGQRQRVAIGRAIVREPEVFLFDEPLSNLDAELRVQMRIELVKLHNRLKSTMIYVTHDQVEAMTMADKIVVLREGLVEQIGSPDEVYSRPANLFVASFIGSPKMNFFSGEIKKQSSSQTEIAFLDRSIPSVKIKTKKPSKSSKLSIGFKHLREIPEGEAVTMGVRPEHFYLEKGKNRLEMNLTTVILEALGSTSHLHCRSERVDDMVVEVKGNPKIKGNRPIKVYFSLDEIYLFDREEKKIIIS